MKYRAFDFSTGAHVAVSDFRGTAVLLTTWSVWCTACKAELPAFETFWEAHRDSGLVMVEINVDAAPDRPRANVMRSLYGLTMPVWADPANSFSTLFSAKGIPTSALIDPQGVLVKVFQGALDLNSAAFRTAMATALPGWPDAGIPRDAATPAVRDAGALRHDAALLDGAPP